MKKPVLILFIILGILITGVTTISVIGSENVFPEYINFHHRGGYHHNDTFHRHDHDFETYEWMYNHLDEEQRDIVDAVFAQKISETDFTELDNTQTLDAMQSIKDEMIIYIETNFTEFSDDTQYSYGCHR